MRNVEEVFLGIERESRPDPRQPAGWNPALHRRRAAVLVSEAAGRFLNTERDNILGLQAREIFDRSTVLGRLSTRLRYRHSSHSGGDPNRDGKAHSSIGGFIFDDRTSHGLGALITLHDLESAEAIESEIELSRRMAAIGRLTSGVGHEVKNPINAIVVHVELLKSKLTGASAPAYAAPGDHRG